MKRNIIRYMAGASIVLASMTACQDHFDDMKMETPAATIQANMTIAEFKAEFWQDDNNYCVEIPAREDGSHYIISGRVISSDYDGNIFKCLYIQDETAALPMSINQYNLYMTNRRGQEIIIDLTGMYVGKYNGMLQLGFPEWYDQGACWETSFMAPELFNLHRQYNGNPDASRIDTILVTDFSQLSSDAAGLQKWQGQLVRFNNAIFANAGKPGEKLCAEYHSSGYNQALNINGGGELNVRTSGYAKFWNTPLPAQACDVVGILSYYGTQGWQLLLNDVNGLMNIGNPSIKGTQETPYSVKEAIGLSAVGATTGWVKGYIVGTLAIDVDNVTSNADIQWDAPYIVDSYLVIGQTPETRNYQDCILLPLAGDSPLYTNANLADNPDVAGRWINIEGRFTQLMGMAALTGNNGSVPTFQIEGLEIEDPNAPVADGDGTKETPYNVGQAIAAGATGAEVWVAGYIVGWSSNGAFSPSFTAGDDANAANIILAATPTETDPDKLFPVQLSSTGDYKAVRAALNLKDNPDNLHKRVSVKGTLSEYFTPKIGLRSTSDYQL